MLNYRKIKNTDIILFDIDINDAKNDDYNNKNKKRRYEKNEENKNNKKILFISEDKRKVFLNCKSLFF